VWMRLGLRLLLFFAFTSPLHAQILADVPGVSSTLYSSPFYNCSANWYVATTGNDTTGTGTSSNPWLTIQRANDQGPTAGICINVEPGTYANGTSVSYGGNAATPTGYVVYRCTSLDACVVTNAYYGFQIASNGGPSFTGPNYVIFDGFDLAAGSEVTEASGIGVFDLGDEGSTTGQSVHRCQSDRPFHV
jgi:hypothetical protein